MWKVNEIYKIWKKKMAEINYNMLNEFQFGRKETDAVKNICSVFGNDAIDS